MDEKPWWWPEIIDDDYLARLRADYPENAGWDDEPLLDYYEFGKDKGDFVETWDNLKDAYGSYEKLAKAFLKLVEETGKSFKDFSEIQ